MFMAERWNLGMLQGMQTDADNDFVLEKQLLVLIKLFVFTENYVYTYARKSAFTTNRRWQHRRVHH
jgi:hypothetical protein